MKKEVIDQLIKSRNIRLRQLGEAKLWIEGFEPIGVGSHGTSLDSLKELDIKDKIRFNYLDRFKKIRHDANYRGYRVLISQTQEIIDFWHKCSKEIISILKKKL